MRILTGLALAEISTLMLIDKKMPWKEVKMIVYVLSFCSLLSHRKVQCQDYFEKLRPSSSYLVA